MSSISDLLALLDSEFYQVAAYPADADRELRRVVIIDGKSDATIRAGDIIFAIGFDADSPAFADLVSRAAAGNASLVACRASTRAEVDSLAALGARHRACLIGIHSAGSWEGLDSIARLLVAESSANHVARRRSAPNSDLFSLADTAAMMVNAPVVIDDANLEVIAYSTQGDHLDEVRERSIALLRPDPEMIDWLDSSGQLSRIRRTIGPCQLDVLGGAHRWAIAIRAGVEIVGFLWVATDSGLTPQAALVLSEVARQAAQMIIRSRLSQGLEWNNRSYLLREALSGNLRTAEIAEEFAMAPDSPCRVIAFSTVGVGNQDRALTEAVQAMASLMLGAESRGAVAAIHHGVVYAIVPESPDRFLAREVLLANQVVQRASRRFSVVVHGAVGPAINRASDVIDGLRSVERLFELGEFDPQVSAVRSYSELRTTMMLDQLLRFVEQRPHMLVGPVADLWRIDVAKGTDYTRTLKEYFECQSDLTLASRALGIHRNTLKYRLARIKELTEIDLDSAPSRLIVELQTKIFAARIPKRRLPLEFASVDAERWASQ